MDRLCLRTLAWTVAQARARERESAVVRRRAIVELNRQSLVTANSVDHVDPPAPHGADFGR